MAEMTATRDPKRLVGRPLEIVSGLSNLSAAEVMSYREMFARKGYTLPDITFPEVTHHIPQKKPRQTRHREPVGTALANRISGLLGIKAGSGCNCKDLAAKMDAWGVAGCEGIHRAEIIAALVSNRDILVDALRTHGTLGHAAGLAVEFIPEIMLRAGAGLLLNRAIEDVRTGAVCKPKRERVPRPQRPSRQPSADGMKRFSAKLKAEQDALHAINQQAPKPSPDPFIGEPVLHFGAHLWPTPGNWQWHVQLWNLMPPLINGRCFVGIATDPGTDTAEQVRAALHPRFECFEYGNNREGENHTFRWLQKVVPQGLDDVLIYCHGKGAKSNTSQSEAIRRWTRAMYQTVIFNHDMIRQRLGEGYKIAHSFRVFGSKVLSPKNRWHPSGTFFAVRAKYLAGRAVKPRYGGVEAWPGEHFAANEAWCEFYDNCMFTTLYDHRACAEVVEPMLTEWSRVSRYER